MPSAHDDHHPFVPARSTSTFPLTINNLHCFGDWSSSPSFDPASINTSFSSTIFHHFNRSANCSQTCLPNQSQTSHRCILCLNALYYQSNADDDLFVIKNGLRFISDGQNPRYLLQTVSYKWHLLTDLSNYLEWKVLNEILKSNAVGKFFAKAFPRMTFWWSSELFSTYTMMEQLEQEKYVLTGIKFTIVLIFLVLSTGVLGIFVTLTTLFNFLTCVGLLTLLNYTFTVEHMAYFTVALIICSQYSVLYSIRYVTAIAEAPCSNGRSF